MGKLSSEDQIANQKLSFSLCSFSYKLVKLSSMRLGFQWGTSDSNSAHCMALENVKVGINCVLLSFTAFATFILYQSNKRKK